MNRRLVYTIKRPGDKKPTGLALNCHLWHGAFRYFDMEHGHEIPGKVTEDGEDAFTFTSEGYAPGAWRFEKLTIERFRRETYKIVEGGQLHCPGDPQHGGPSRMVSQEVWRGRRALLSPHKFRIVHSKFRIVYA